MFTFKKAGLSSIILGLGLNFMAVQADWNQDQQQNRWNTSYSNETSDPDQDQGTYKNTTGVSDQDLTKKIKDKIGSGWFTKGYDEVTVQVNNGMVTLGGMVKTWDDKEKVEKDVRNIDGVRKVNSQIVVQEPISKDNRKDRKEQREFPQDTYATPADNQLNQKIRDKVSRGWLWDSYKDVNLNTNNSVVTLEGTVDSDKDQQKIMKEVRKVEGVRAVNSNLLIKNG